MTCGVYALLDPVTKRVVYVGRSVNIERRYERRHQTTAYEPGCASERFVNEQYLGGRDVPIVVLEECEPGKIAERERHYIGAYELAGFCVLNRNKG